MERGELAKMLREDVARSTGREMSTRESETIATRMLEDGARSRQPDNRYIADRAKRDREG